MTEQKIMAPPYESIIVDEHIELRALHSADASEFFNLIDNSRKSLGRFLTWVEATRTIDDSLAFIAKTTEKRAQGEAYSFAIVVDGELAGHINLMHLTSDSTPEIGYWIAQRFEGQGITTKATKALTQYGLETLRLPKILIRAVPDNGGSNAIPPKLGYRFVGLRDDKDGSHNHWVIEKRQSAGGAK